jgi:hypothetical protein
VGESGPSAIGVASAAKALPLPVAPEQVQESGARWQHWNIFSQIAQPGTGLSLQIKRITNNDPDAAFAAGGRP